MRGENIPTYNQSGGGNMPWINPPLGPPNNLKGIGGGVNSPRNNYNADARKGAPPERTGENKRELVNVHENSDDPPGYAY